MRCFLFFLNFNLVVIYVCEDEQVLKEPSKMLKRGIAFIFRKGQDVDNGQGLILQIIVQDVKKYGKFEHFNYEISQQNDQKDSFVAKIS